MKLLKSMKRVCDFTKKAASSMKRFSKEPLLWAGLASVSTVLGCAYGPEPEECTIGESTCLNNYAAMCRNDAADFYSNHWFGIECEKGCDSQTNTCIENKVVGAEVTDCAENESKCDGNNVNICIDKIWYTRFCDHGTTCVDGRCVSPSETED